MSRPSALLLRSQSDARLLELAREGHERAFEAIVERYRRPLLRACRRVLPEARAEDAVQQALVAAWTALERGYEVRELRPWLFRIAHNTALNQLRVSGYDHDELLDGLRGGAALEDELERRIVVRATLAGVAALPERQRQALLRIAVEGRAQEDVAAELGVSEGAVRQLVHRARVQLRAAATAATPMPIAIWMADLAGGAATAGGAAATAVKAGAAVVLVTGAAAGPVLVHHGSPQAGRRDTAAAAPPRARPHRAKAAATPAVARVAETVPAAATPAATAAPRGRETEPGDDHSGPSPRSGTSRRVSGAADDEPSRSGGGPGPSPSSRADDGGDDHHGGRRSGSGDGSTAPATVVPVSTPTGDDGGGEGETVEAADDSGSSDSSGPGSGEDRTVLAAPDDDSSHSGGGGDDGSSSGPD